MSTVLLESSLTTCRQDMSIYFEALSQFILMLMVTKTHQSSLINILKQTPFFSPTINYTFTNIFAEFQSSEHS